VNPEVCIPESRQAEIPAGQIRALFLPGRDLFARRADRFRLLSAGHPLGDYLDFLALLADGQHRVLHEFPVLPLPGPEEQALCRQQDLPLLDCRSWLRDPAWRWGLKTILQQMREAAVPPAARETAARLMQTSESGLEARADRILAGDLVDISPQELPFAAAALQVYWVHMASSLGHDACGRLERGGLCPVCGSYPGAGMVRIAGAEQGLRYLACSLCASQWHMVRIKCSNCASTHGIDYYALEGSDGAVKAESCSDCNSYLKLFYLEKDPHMETTADDVATLALDMLMHKEGKARVGPNLFFHPGQSD
jgi:FdhE protein